MDELKLQTASGDEENLRNKALQDELLTIPGVMITDTPVRSYPLGEKAAHLVGYVQNVTAEDLEEHQGEGYLTDSVIGRTGMESLFEKELKGKERHAYIHFICGGAGKAGSGVSHKNRRSGYQADNRQPSSGNDLRHVSGPQELHGGHESVYRRSSGSGQYPQL